MLEFFKTLFDVTFRSSGIMITINPYAVVIVLLLFAFLYLFIRATRSGRLDWTDMITHPGPSNVVSLTKVLQLTGGVVATWIMIYTTLHDKLSVDLFFAYLTYVGAIEGWSRFVTAKYGANTNNGNGFSYSQNAMMRGGSQQTPYAPRYPSAQNLRDDELDAALPKGDK